MQVLYDQRTYNTRTLYNSVQPMWNETFVFPENPSLLARCAPCVTWHVPCDPCTHDTGLDHANKKHAVVGLHTCVYDVCGLTHMRARAGPCG